MSCFSRSLIVIASGALTTAITTSALAGGFTPTQPKMGDPLDGLTAQQLADFFLGQSAYNTPLQAEEGLGPIFNKESCGNCHSNPLGSAGSQTVTRFGSAGKGGFNPLDQFGGSLLQHSSISLECAEVIPVEANVTSFRVTNGMMGYGLVEAIDGQDILDVREAQQATVQGVAHMVPAFEDAVIRVGRFGWKAQVATILTFSADASLNEMGLTNRFVMTENDPNGIRPPALGDPDFCDEVADPEDSIAMGNGVDKEFIDIVTDFQRFLAAPPQTPKFGMTGETVFNNLGCAECHHPGFTTPDDPGLEDAIRNKTVKAYSDFLLHDMGASADFIDQGGVASERMIKTPPLMGLRMRDPVWHDGRVEVLEFATAMDEAIALHGVQDNQGAVAAAAYASASDTQKAQLIAFLNSLGRAEFDTDGDNDVDMEDFHGFSEPGAFRTCFGGGPYTADDPCAVHDIDQDGDVDLDDYASFISVFEGTIEDCNENGEDDMLDILLGTSTDNNRNGMPDECCLADTDGSGDVDVNDLINVILQWGPCPAKPAPCSADIVPNGVVNVQDLLEVIANWGGCA